jgi:hypothetical protein
MKGQETTRGYGRIIAVAALTAGMLLVFAMSAIAVTMHVHGVYDKKNDAYRALAIRTDTNKKKSQAAQRKAEVAQQRALELAVADTKNEDRKHAERVLRRVVRKMKSASRRKVNQAYEKGKKAGFNSGYGSGQSAGYANGKDAGFNDGFDEAYTFCYVDDGYFC